MPYSYTNRKGKAHYFRAVETKTGKYRYYVTSSKDYPDLIESIPEGFEVAELPEDARVVLRKEKKKLITTEEKNTLQEIIEEASAIKDFFIFAQDNCLYIYHSAFNYEGGQDHNLSREEAKAAWGQGIEKWMRFFCSLRFLLIDKEKRLFQAEREVVLGFSRSEFFTIGEPGPLEEVAKEFGQHLGRESFYRIEPNLSNGQ